MNSESTNNTSLTDPPHKRFLPNGSSKKKKSTELMNLSHVGKTVKSPNSRLYTSPNTVNSITLKGTILFPKCN